MKSTKEIISEGMAERGAPFLLIGGMALPAFDVVRQTVDEKELDAICLRYGPDGVYSRIKDAL